MPTLRDKPRTVLKTWRSINKPLVHWCHLCKTWWSIRGLGTRDRPRSLANFRDSQYSPYCEGLLNWENTPHLFQSNPQIIRYYIFYSVNFHQMYGNSQISGTRCLVYHSLKLFQLLHKYIDKLHLMIQKFWSHLLIFPCLQIRRKSQINNYVGVK